METENTDNVKWCQRCEKLKEFTGNELIKRLPDFPENLKISFKRYNIRVCPDCVVTVAIKVDKNNPSYILALFGRFSENNKIKREEILCINDEGTSRLGKLLTMDTNSI